MEAQHAQVRRWAEASNLSRGYLESLSLTLPPCRLSDSTPQTSAQGASQLTAAVEAIEALALGHPWPARHEALSKVRKQVLALAALVDFWWQGVPRDVEPFLLAPRWWQWVHECLLPRVYGAYQGGRTRGRRRKATLHAAGQAGQAAFDRHPITQRLAPHILAAWHAWALDRGNALQRASSAVAGRHGVRSQRHHNQRGLPKHRYKVWTVWHNLDGRAADDPTPAARFFRREFPDLFETVLAQVGALPRPRQRNQGMALRG